MSCPRGQIRSPSASDRENEGPRVRGSRPNIPPDHVVYRSTISGIAALGSASPSVSSQPIRRSQEGLVGKLRPAGIVSGIKAQGSQQRVGWLYLTAMTVRRSSRRTRALSEKRYAEADCSRLPARSERTSASNGAAPRAVNTVRLSDSSNDCQPALSAASSRVARAARPGAPRERWRRRMLQG